MSKKNGFTLIELMVVVVIIAILAGIAIPSYQSYIRKSKETKIQQEILKISEQLERHRVRNFNYRNFTLTSLDIPDGYTLNIYDIDDTSKGLTENVQGRGWYIMVTPPDDAKSYYYLMGSNGLKCKSHLKNDVNFKCETGDGADNQGSESW